MVMTSMLPNATTSGREVLITNPALSKAGEYSRWSTLNLTLMSEGIWRLKVTKCKFVSTKWTIRTKRYLEFRKGGANCHCAYFTVKRTIFSTLKCTRWLYSKNILYFVLKDMTINAVETGGCINIDTILRCLTLEKHVSFQYYHHLPHSILSMGGREAPNRHTCMEIWGCKFR